VISQFLAVGTNTGAKYAAPAGIFALFSELTVGGIDIAMVGAIVIGLASGAMIRLSFFIREPDAKQRIRSDIMVSFLSAMANLIIAGIMVAAGTLAMPDLPLWGAAGVGMVVGFRGNDNVPAFARKWMNLEVEKPNAETMRKGLYDATDRPKDGAMDDLIRRIDDDEA
jgi:hypothetical protein